MQVTVYYLAQLRRAAGCATERVEAEPGLTLGEFLRRLGESRGEPFRTLLLAADGRPQRSLLFFIGDKPAEPSRVLQGDEELSILTPMAGG
jgi:molybdopterin converting factor small subunit